MNAHISTSAPSADPARAATISVEAEQSVLCAMLIDNTALDRIQDILTVGHFYRFEHKHAFTAIGKLINAGKPADVVTVFDELASVGRAEECGGLAYLTALAQSVPSAANIRRYAEIVRERADLRDLLDKIERAGTLALAAVPMAEKLDKVAALFVGIDARNSTRRPRPIGEIMVKVLDGIQAAAEGQDLAWRTGVAALDSMLNGGLRPGKLVVLAARPGVGKTSLAKQIARQVAAHRHPALVLSQEMECEELAERSLASQARVDYSALQTGKLADQQWTALCDGVEVLRGLPLWIDDEPALTLRAINSKARSVKGLRVLVLDYIQLSDGEGDTRTAQVGSISRGLKKLAKELGICIIALSQLNRAVEQRPGRRPQLSDLRDSGEIEQDADTIVFMWPLSEQEDGAEVRPIGVEIAKNRRGRKGVFVFNFEGRYQRWTESEATLDTFQTRTKKAAFE